MMASPLVLLQNASIEFQLPIAGTVLDSVGNVQPATETITIKCKFKKAPSRSADGLTLREIENSNIVSSTEVLLGRATDPMLLDDRIITGLEGILTMGDDPPQRCRVLNCRYPNGTAGIGAITRKIIGDAIDVLVIARQ